MNVIIGFGDSHFEQTKKDLQMLIETIANELEALSLEQISFDCVRRWIDEYKEKLGLFDNKYSYLFCLASVFNSYCLGAVILYGNFKHYKKDSPFSPDGWAMMEIPFAVTFYISEWSGKREMTIFKGEPYEREK